MRASRKELFGTGAASASDEDDDEDDGNEVKGDSPSDVEDEGEDIPFGQAEEGESSSSDEDAPFTPAAAPAAVPPTESLEASQILSSLRQSRFEDVSKGLAVKKQLEFFESVLLVRMKMQKAVVGLGALKVRPCPPNLRLSIWRPLLTFTLASIS